MGHSASVNSQHRQIMNILEFLNSADGIHTIQKIKKLHYLVSPLATRRETVHILCTNFTSKELEFLMRLLPHVPAINPRIFCDREEILWTYMDTIEEAIQLQ